MRPTDYSRIWLGRALAPLTVRYGEPLRFAGGDLPAPRVQEIRTRHGRIPVHVYAGRAGAGVLVHFHGGAWMMRYPEMDDWWCRYVVAETGVSVVNVDYDVAPHTRFPTAHEQCHDVAVDFAGRFEKLALSGFSSGANLAAGVALMGRDRGDLSPALQILGCPALDLLTEPRDDEPGMLSAAMRRMVRRVYFAEEEDRGSPYASPLHAPDLRGLPPAVVLTGECDVLCAEGAKYAGRLAAAGVPVTYDVTPGADHYFLTGDPERARHTMALAADRVRAQCA